MIEAAIVNNVEITKLLLEHKADINESDVTGRTALHWSTHNDNYSLTELLLQHEANPNAYSLSSQPILVTPLLRGFTRVKKLLYQYGADLKFAQDFISAKLLGHRYELKGQVDIVTPKNEFIEFDFEGFFLEVTLGILRDSLHRYRNHFIARHLRGFFHHIHELIYAFDTACELVKFQRYTVNVNHHQKQIDTLLNRKLLILPVGYEGHAVTFIKYENLLVKCDRGEESRNLGGGVFVYQITNPDAMNKQFLKRLLYTKHNGDFINYKLHQILGLKQLYQFPLSSQISGNCSWANVEACVPLTLFLLFYRQPNMINNLKHSEELALNFYQEWHAWDQDRALYDCIQSFYEASPQRQASKTMILAAILFQSCLDISIKKNVQRAEKILKVLTLPDFKPLLQSYVNVYYIDSPTAEGKQLVGLLNYCDIDFEIANKGRANY